MYSRNFYLDRIEPFLGTPVIKIITGMRRVGKSAFLQLLADHFRTKLATPADHMLYIDKESLEFEDIVDYRDLHARAKAAFADKSGRKLLLVDEIQEIGQWERAIASLAKDQSLDIVITGSNAHMLSSELATLLAGRYIEFPIYTLSLSEFLRFRERPPEHAQQSFAEYIKYGGLPGLSQFPLDEPVIYAYISGIYHTILLKDVVKRNQVRSVAQLESIARYLFDNIGNITSASRIAQFVRSQRLSLSVDTVQNYLRFFTDAFVAYRVPRYDLKGKRLLEIHEKYYLGDVGLRHALLGYREGDISGILENVVYMELRRRGYEVCIGSLGGKEIDFIATRQSEKVYIQVAYLLASPDTITRELTPLQSIPDNYPKLILSLDTTFGHDLAGIQRINLIDWLMQATSEA